MFLFNQSVTPAAKNHLEAHLSFFNDVSKSMFRSIQQFSDLHVQLAQTLLEESTNAGHHALTAAQPMDMLNAVAAHAQPAVGKLHAYQQTLSRLAADTQVDLAKVAEQHVQETSRTAKALSEEVARVATEETDKSVRKQQEAMRNLSNPFEQFANGMHNRQAASNEMRASGSMQSAGGPGAAESREGQVASMQGGTATPQGSAGGGLSSGKQPGGSGTRKE